MSYWQLDKTMLVFRNYTDIIAEQLTLTFWLINDIVLELPYQKTQFLIDHQDYYCFVKQIKVIII